MVVNNVDLPWYQKVQKTPDKNKLQVFAPLYKVSPYKRYR